MFVMSGGLDCQIWCLSQCVRCRMPVTCRESTSQVSRVILEGSPMSGSSMDIFPIIASNVVIVGLDFEDEGLVFVLSSFC